MAEIVKAETVEGISVGIYTGIRAYSVCRGEGKGPGGDDRAVDKSYRTEDFALKRDYGGLDINILGLMERRLCGTYLLRDDGNEESHLGNYLASLILLYFRK